MKTAEVLKKFLLQFEKHAPQLTSRAWGIWQNPLAELLGLKVTQINDTQIEVSFKNLTDSTSLFLAAGELALKTLWKRHLGDLEKPILTRCNFEVLLDISNQHFVARTELLENDRERVMREARRGLAVSSEHGTKRAEIESLVLFFDSKKRLAAQAHYTLHIMVLRRNK